MEKKIYSGNEAIARGAFEAGIRFGAAYPGTPSTEVMEEFAKYPGVYAEWSPNEKVALEVAIGSALAGERTMAAMKHVGVNVAADPLFTVSYTGVEGALVIVSADDPSLHSSQNEQDNRNYAKFARIPMLEPADSQEAKEFMKLAVEISEKFDTPVFLRSTTRVSHSKSIVSLGEPVEFKDRTELKTDAAKYVMVPFNARMRRKVVEERTIRLKEFAEGFKENRVEMNSPEVGIITAGMVYNYVKDVFPQYSCLKLGLVFPLPEKMIRDFAAKVKKVYVAEEMDPYLEDQIKAMGIKVEGKSVFPYTGEFDPGVVANSLAGTSDPSCPVDLARIPPRPPNLCPGCPHRGVFYVLGKLKAFVAGDIGCYTLSFMKPLEGLHSCICMGASLGMAHGMSKALRDKGKGKVVGVIGDSTFIHSGITPLLNMAYNKGDALAVILDNRTTAMTGMQDHPATGRTLQGEKTKALNFAELGKVLGMDSVRVVDPFKIKATRAVVREELERQGPSLIISEGPCVLLNKTAGKPFTVDMDKCIGCKTCIGLNCPPISWRKYDVPKEPKQGKKKIEGYSMIDPTLCNGCTLCQQLCPKGAIVEVSE